MIINYCSGGLGNRLKPLSSCYAISKITGRPLGIIWFPTMRCGAKFDQVFSNDIKTPTIQEIIDSNSVTIYSHREWVDHDHSLNGNPTLCQLANKFGVHTVDNSENIIKDNNKYVIVYSNDYLVGYTPEQCKEFFKYLLPIHTLKEKINSQAILLGINKSVIGVHARGTDFEPSGVTVHTYITQIDAIYRTDNKKKFFICSDSKEYEDAILSTFPNNIIINTKNSWVYKSNRTNSWVNNVETPAQSVQDAVIDMYLLSKTDFRIYNNNSTFAHVVNMLS